jgi:putative acyl-CoA dehydrogenase
MSEEPLYLDTDVNQSPPFAEVNLYDSDRALQDAVAREGGAQAGGALSRFGARAGSAEMLELARHANENAPRLKKDGVVPGGATIEFDPAYHAMMEISMGEGLHCSTWEHLAEADAAPRPDAHVARCGAFFMAAQMEAGHCCPVTMTHAAVAALQRQPNLLREWLPKILSRDYDPAFEPMANKASVTLGMGMTERQGGTDVRANTARAEPVNGGGPGGEYTISGHKWFMSAPMCDAFLVLAQAPGGLSCFLLPRYLPNASVNAIRFQRLKDKLGNRSNPSSEVEFTGAHGWLIGEEGRGIPTILEMVTLTRLDCAVSSAGLMRFGLAAAIHHCRHRSVFQRKLIDQPLMTRVLADMALETEAATTLVFRLARAFDLSGEDEREAAYRRLMTPVAKYRVCKAAPAFAYEAMECLGGNGYVEDATPLARVYREAPVNSIWEGSGNVICLDVLRALQRAPEAGEAILAEVATTRGQDAHLDAFVDTLKDRFKSNALAEADGRRLTEDLALALQGSLLVRHAPAAVADAFCAARLSGEGGYSYGTSVGNADVDSIIARGMPQL